MNAWKFLSLRSFLPRIHWAKVFRKKIMTRSLGLDVALLAASLPTCETNSWVFGWYDLQHPKRSDERALRLFTNERYELKRRNAKAGVFFLMQDPLNAVSLDTIMRGVGNPGLWKENSLLRTHLSLFWTRWACYAAASFGSVRAQSYAPSGWQVHPHMAIFCWACQGLEQELNGIISTSLGGLTLEDLSDLCGMNRRVRIYSRGSFFFPEKRVEILWIACFFGNWRNIAYRHPVILIVSISLMHSWGEFLAFRERTQIFTHGYYGLED